VRLADRPELLNSAGNDVHFLGMSWSGAYEEPAARHASVRDVTAASGAGMVCRRDVWDALGGFAEEFFAYYEDADLSLRSWQRGWAVRYVPEAVVVHRYEFSRNLGKFELLERNRLSMELSVFGARHLAVIAPLAVALELGLLLMAARQGWLGHKLAAYRWLVAHRRWLRARRRAVQGARVRSDAEMAALFATHLQPGNMPGAHAPRSVEALVGAYWRLVRPLLGSPR
jgi:GT2 family glycosyltransferase